MIRCCILFLLLMSTLADAQTVLPLYPGAVPNARDVADTERTEPRGENNRAVYGVASPALEVYRPADPNGTAVVICPGGGYGYLSFDKEGVLVARRLNEAGITAFVLKYRIPQDATNVDKSLAPLMDAQQAIRSVRAAAADYGVDPGRIGILGFSAGGHLAATAATRFGRMADPNVRDTTSVRPDFAGLIYPVISMDSTVTHRGSRENLLGPDPAAALVAAFSADEQVTDATPPSFLVHAADDSTVPVRNTLRYYDACLAHGVPAEVHLYAAGGHGFGMYNPTTSDDWVERFLNWLQTLD